MRRGGGDGDTEPDGALSQVPGGASERSPLRSHILRGPKWGDRARGDAVAQGRASRLQRCQQRRSGREQVNIDLPPLHLIRVPLLKGRLVCSAGTSTLSLPPGWVDISDQVSADMQRARSKMAELAKAHSRALMPTFDDTSREEHTIELLSQQITTLLKKCEQKLQQLSGPTGPSEQDASVRKNVQVSGMLLPGG